MIFESDDFLNRQPESEQQQKIIKLIETLPFKRLLHCNEEKCLFETNTIRKQLISVSYHSRKRKAHDQFLQE